MTRIEYENNLRMMDCSSCYGTWIGHFALMRLVNLDVAALREGQTPEGQPDSSLEDLAAVVMESNSKGELRCPECEKVMSKDRFHPMIPVDVDCCRKCNGLWLDTGEKNLLRRLYQELMMSDDPKIVAMREKAAAMYASWGGRSMPAEVVHQSGGSIFNGIDGIDGVGIATDVLGLLVRTLVR